MCNKIDLRQTYNRLSREFILNMLKEMNFKEKWIKLIREVIRSLSFSIIYQGSSYGFFQSSTGLREGDPLSPPFHNRLGKFYVASGQ